MQSELLKTLKREYEMLTEEDSKLATMNSTVKRNLENFTSTDAYKQFSYATFEDIRALTKDNDSNLIAIRAPSGTSIEIPEVESIQKLYNQTLEVSNFI